MEFDFATSEALGHYVYCLLDLQGQPFYVGKGVGNRVFAHALASISEDGSGLKLDTIRKIKEETGRPPQHMLIRSRLSSDEAFTVEGALIDFCELVGLNLTNVQLGHRAHRFGLMTAEEAVALFSAQKLEQMDDDCVIININKTKRRGSSEVDIYEAVRGDWVIGKPKRDQIKYALAEKRGLIVGVFYIGSWAPVSVASGNGLEKTRWRFEGVVAPEEIRAKYLNKSIAHIKAKGAANPIRYRLEKPEMNASVLFSPEPMQFGLRGDGPLWLRLAIDMEKMKLPSSAGEFERMVYDAAEAILGVSLEDLDEIKCAELETMGMSSGFVHGPTWREKLVPLLVSRFRARNKKQT